MKLYELTANYEKILEMMEQSENPQDLQDTLDSINDAIEIKVENYGKIITQIKADEQSIDAEIERLQNKKNALKNTVDYLKKHVEENMIVAGIKKIKTPIFSFTIQKNPQRLDIETEKYIPREFYVEQAPKLNKRALLTAIKDGHVIQGVTTKQTESLRIR